MKRTILNTLSALLCMVCAVTTQAQSLSKQINDVKRSSDYISAEATMETEAKAYELAEELLSKQIEDYVAEQKALKKAPNIIVKDVAGKAEKLQMNRGEMVRVFLYVKKSDVLAADNTRVLVQPANIPEAKPAKAKEEKTKPAKEEKAKPAKQQKAVEPVAQTAAADVPAETPVVTTVSSAGGDASLRLPVEWQQEVVDALLACATANEAQAKLARLQIEKRVKRFGAAADCRNPQEAFWLVFDDGGQVVTVLGPGTAERTNFRSLTRESLDAYKGKGAIWFTLR